MGEAALIAIIVAKIKKYRVGLLFKDYAIYPAVIFTFIYLAVQISVFNGIFLPVKYISVFQPLYLISFIIPMIKYKQHVAGIIGAGFIFLGTILNKIVIAQNGGKMPVFATLSKITGFIKSDFIYNIGTIHSKGEESAKLIFLADIFDLGYIILSIGDILIFVFAYLIVFYSIKHLNTVN